MKTRHNPGFCILRRKSSHVAFGFIPFVQKLFPSFTVAILPASPIFFSGGLQNRIAC